MMQNQILKKGKLYLLSSITVSVLLSGCFGGEEKKQASAEAVVKPVEQPKVEQPASTAVTESVAKEAVEKVEVAKEEVKDVVATVEKEVQQTPVATPAIDGAKLYAKCASCHGANGEKVALNVSKIIKDLSKENFISAVKGYQSGTYGGSMKTLMTGQVKSLTEDEIKAIANYIIK
ncbi:MAG: c-type cytochrome [Arcobacteraceae bacterium]